MKVISINDAPMPQKGYYHNGVYYERAYYKGDIFEVYDRTTWGGNGVSGEYSVTQEVVRDKLKIEYCNKNKIKLYIIRYDQDIESEMYKIMKEN